MWQSFNGFMTLPQGRPGRCQQDRHQHTMTKEREGEIEPYYTQDEAIGEFRHFAI